MPIQSYCEAKYLHANIQYSKCNFSFAFFSLSVVEIEKTIANFETLDRKNGKEEREKVQFKRPFIRSFIDFNRFGRRPKDRTFSFGQERYKCFVVV